MFTADGFLSQQIYMYVKLITKFDWGTIRADLHLLSIYVYAEVISYGLSTSLIYRFMLAVSLAFKI